jgi:hypothetical protein
MDDKLDKPLNDNEQLLKDRSYAPSSGRETERMQTEQDIPEADAGIDADAVKTLPGTGGPDDVGDIEVDPADLNMPHGEGAH